MSMHYPWKNGDYLLENLPAVTETEENEDPENDELHPIVSSILQNAGAFICIVLLFGGLFFFTMTVRFSDLNTAEMINLADMGTMVITIFSIMFGFAALGNRWSPIPVAFLLNTILFFPAAGYLYCRYQQPNNPTNHMISTINPSYSNRLTNSEDNLVKATILSGFAELACIIRLYSRRSKKRIHRKHKKSDAPGGQEASCHTAHDQPVHVQFYDPIPGSEQHEVIINDQQEHQS